MPPPYSAGSVFLQVVPSFAGVQEDIKAHAERYGKLFGDVAGKEAGEGFAQAADEGAKKATARARDRGQKAGEEYAKGVATSAPKVEKEISRALERSGPAAEKQGAKAADKYAGKFATTLKRQVSAMNRELDAVQMHVDDAEALAGIERVKRAVAGLKDGKIEVDFDGEAAVEAMTALEKILTRMSSETMHIRTAVDLDQAARDAAVVRKMVESVLGKPVDIPVNARAHGAGGDNAAIGPGGTAGSGKPIGALSERALGSFERTFRSSIESALRDMPALEISIDDDKAKAEVERIRAALQELRGKRLGTDLSTDDALAKLRELMDAVNRLEGSTADVRVRSDAGTAYRELRATFDLVEKLEKADAKVHVEATGAATTASQLRAVNREAKNTSGNGMDAANAFRAFNGRMFAFVALAPAAIPLLGAVAGGLAAIGGMALIGGAGLGVAALGFSGISNAVQGLNDVQQNATADAVGRTRQLRSAARGVRDAEQQLARARKDSAQSVEDAERRVADAQKDAQKAQDDLIDSRKEGAQQLEDLSLRARGGALAERQAALDLARAQSEYISTFADGSSTNVEREQAAIALEREKLGYEQARLENKRLQEQQADAAKTGVEGTDVYQTALERVAGANQNVQAAEENRQRAQEDAAQSIADATQSLADAQEDYTTAVEQTGDVGSSSMRNLKKAMDELGPAGQDFAKYLFSLKPFLKELRTEAQEGLLPGVQSWMESITDHYGPDLMRTVSGLSGALGDVFEMWGTSLKGDAFSKLFDMIENDGPRWIRELGSGVTDLGEGFAYLLVAARPFTDLFLGYFRDLSADFRDWASQVKGSTWLHDFFDYARRITPEVGDLLKQFFGALLNLLTAVAPYGEIVMRFLTAFLRWVADMDPVQLGAIATAIFTLTTAMQAIFGLTSLVKSAEAAWRLATGTLGDFVGKVPLLAGGVLALVGGLIILYTSSAEFRDIIDTLVGSLADLIGMVNDSVGPLGLIAIAVAGWIVFRNASGWVSTLDASTSKLKSGLGLLQTAIGGVGIAVGILGAIYAVGQGQIDRWAQAITDGGDAAGKAVDEMNRKFADTSTIGKVWDYVKLFFADITAMFQGYSDAQEAAAVKSAETLAAMDPLARAQQNVRTATADLATAQETYGVKSDEAGYASGRLAEAQGRLEGKQRDVEKATRDASDALADQADQILAAEDSNIAMQQAQLEVTRATENYRKVMGDSKSTANDRKAAELQLRSAFQQVGDAAARQASDQAKLRGETLTATQSSAAQLQALKDLRTEMGDNLPPEIDTLIGNLERTAGAADKVAGAADGVTGAVTRIPGTKDVFINGLTQDAIDKLTALGIDVEEFPDGHFEVHAKTEQAQTDLDAFVAQANQKKILIGVEVLDAIWSGKGGTPVVPGQKVNGGQLPGLWIPGVTPGKATGGPIEGPGTATSDSVPILASDGEYMIKAASVNKYGRGFFDLLNAGRFAIGGLISKTLPRFATGGPVSIPSWNPAVTSAGADTSPIADAWAEVITAIGQNTGAAAPLLAQMWAALRDSALGSVGDLREGATGEWTGLTHDLATQTDVSLTATEQRFRDMRSAVGAVAGGTRDDLGTIFGTLRTVTADPVNFVISNVLGAGLFTALNSVSDTFGLNKTIPAPTPVSIPRLAVGGRVPGFSPTPTADNIPAMLTAREFVQPVSSVDYYGVDFMEAIRQRRIPKSLLPHLATGGQVGTWPQLNALRAQLFPGSVMTSGFRPGAHDWHGAGNAIDIGVPGNKPSLLAQIARKIAMMFPQSTELINNPGGSIKNGRTVPSSFWGPATWAAHANHVHWAMTAQALAGAALGATSIPTGLVDSITAPIADLFGQFGTNPFTSSLAAGPRSLADLAWSSLFQSDETAGAPTLYDDGGYLPPGLSMVLNGTGKPEPVLTAEELDLLRNGGAGGGGDRPYIGALTLPMVAANPHEAMDEVMHVVKVAAAGGRYSEIGD